MRGLRAIYNQAVARGLSPQQHPFQAVYTGIAKTVKRALPLSDIHRIKQADLSEEPTLALGHDNETTTRIYLSTLDTTEVDRVNRKILASLK